jgi:hypothetical protein
MTLRLPIDPDGYAVTLSTGTVHTRYAGEHAGTHMRTRTVKGVETLLDGRKPAICKVCYGDKPPLPASTSRPPQQRRSGPKAKATVKR